MRHVLDAPPRRVLLPSYPPPGPTPKHPVRWRRGTKLPGFLKRDPPVPITREQYEEWSTPVWLWYEGRDGLFLTSSSFLMVEGGYWSEGVGWQENGALYLCRGTHAWIQLAGPSALSLCPRSELNTLCRQEGQGVWQVDGTLWTGLTSRPDCYVAQRGLPWTHGLGAVVSIYGGDRRKRMGAKKRMKEYAAQYELAHRNPLRARQTFLDQLELAEGQPCKYKPHEDGWWNVGMRQIFVREAAPISGQIELLPIENWQLFDVDPQTGAWIPR